MAQAVLRLFGNLGMQLARRGLPAGAVHAYLFGGCAVHMHTLARVSSDVDAELLHGSIHRDDVDLVLAEFAPVDYEDPVAGPSQLAYDRKFNTTLGPLHEDYRDRARRLEGGADSPVLVWLPCPEDIAITKLGRLAEVDLADILLLLATPGASWDRFETLAREAARYYVGPDLTPNFEHVKAHWERQGWS